MFVGQFLGLLALLPWIKLSDLANQDYLSSILRDPEFKRPVMIMNACVALGAFITAPLLYLYTLEKKRPTVFFNNTRIITIPLFLTIFIVIAFMSVNSIFIEWNASVTLPDFMKSFEIWAKEMEQQAQGLTIMMTRFDNPGDFILAMIVIGLVPAIGEEILFRGLIQNQFYAITKNIHVAIWLGGLFFSAFHFQFYGLIPRMLLGVLFGYLYYWSGNLIVAMLAHFINNGLTLVLLYMHQLGYINFDIENTTTIPFANVIFSLVLGIVLIIFFRRYFEAGSATMGKWLKVFTSSSFHRTEIVRAVLEDNDLNPVLVNKKDAAYQIGDYEIYVAPEDVLKAIKIIKDDIRFE